MKKKSSSISKTTSVDYHPVKPHNEHHISTECPVSSKVRQVFHRRNTSRESLDYENGCSICGKKDCCADDHHFSGIIPAGWGL